MKIAIVSDLHLGYDIFREDAFKQAYNALNIANEIADMVLIPGDIFDIYYPKPDVIAEAINLFRDLSKKDWKAQVIEVKGTKVFTNVPIVAIPGNHETTAQDKQNPMKLLSLAGLLIDTSSAYTIVQKDDEIISIFGLGAMSDNSVKQKLSELNPTPIKNMFNIFMFHQSIYELLPFNENFMHLNDLPDKFDLYICGHLHNLFYENVHGKKLIIPGSTVLTQLNDTEKKKGFVLFDTKEYSYEFIEINSRKFIIKTIELDNANDSQILEQCESEIDNSLDKEEKPIIKIYLKGSANLSNFSLIIQKLKIKYSNTAYLSINAKELTDPNKDKSIIEVRDNKIDQIPIKELGGILFNKKLKDLDFDFSLINTDKLFEILSLETNKEKAILKAREFLEV
ncbi:MAG: metallophosphoesterase [Candidatus Marsarchaeota archaeon]|nr:metallophosphoesterase [Candidatus Marsarchaeota archaeon]MCL5094382.1 metallophosphoesterase [Candidatus Marsarchaeota archaeon]